MAEYDLKQIILIFRKRLKGLISFILVMALATGYVSYYILEPQYEAFTTLMVGKPQNHNERIEYSDILLSEKLVNTYGEIIRSRSVATKVINNLKLNINYEELREKINVSTLNETEIIVVRVKSKDAVLAARIANEFIKVFMDKIVTLTNIDNVQIIDKARPPVEPISPKPIVNILIASFLAIFLGTTLIILYEYINNTVKSAKTIEEQIKTPVVGNIPKIKRIKTYQDLIITSNTNSTSYSEAFKTLRTNIQFYNIDTQIKSINITSPESADGKSTIASNLAIAMSMLNKKVLLVDADFRKPKLHKIFELSNDLGVTSALINEIDYKKAVQTMHSCNLNILTSGPVPPNPSEILSTNRFKSFVEQMENEYDLVFFDSPPVDQVADALALSSIVDGVITVYSYDKTKVDLACHTKTLLTNVNANILGVVMNKVDKKEMGYSYYRAN